MRLWDFGSSDIDYMMFSAAGGNPISPILHYEAAKAWTSQRTTTFANYAVTNTW
jgi:hypothetical protein